MAEPSKVDSRHSPTGLSRNFRRAAGIAAVAVVLLASTAHAVVGVGERNTPTGDATVDATQDPRTRIVVEPARARGAISPLLYGVNHRYAYDGFGMWDSDQHRAYPGLVAQTRAAGVTAVRYPGGTIANTLRWKRAVGPVGQRERSPHGTASFGEPLTAEFGPDEFGQFLEQLDAAGSIVVNFATGDAREAADWVEYMTAPAGSNPGGGTAWADVRADNGHPAPYDIPYWEVANEPDLAAQEYWRSGESAASTHELYAFGGSTRFERQPVATYDDHGPNAAVSNGAAGQVKYAKYPPVATSGQTVLVDGQEWRQVTDLDSAGTEDVYELDRDTGKITFGDGAHGNIPAEDAVITLTYTSGPHDGFVDFYREMKAVNPDIQVCSAMPTVGFLAAMGSEHAYDCVVQHPYVGPNQLSNDLPVEEFRAQFLAQADNRSAVVAAAQERIRTYAGERAEDVSIVVSEYGHLARSNPQGVEHYHRSLDQGLYNAELLRELIDLGGVSVAMRHTLVDYVFAEPPEGSTAVGAPDNAIIAGPGPETVPQGQAHVFTLFTQMMGGTLVASQVVDSPVHMLQNGDHLQAVTALAGTDDRRQLYLIVINRDAHQDVTARVDPVGYRHGSAAEVWTVNGPSYLSYNTPTRPDTVRLTTRTVAVGHGGFTYTFPAHSVTAIKLSERS
ncbi:alpha-L-arabinofuranosidase C-terminal domain-containing protein [Actinopolymorpha sp. B17G11]|uniref:alpha-L-arabinofuranosidase C-terminal domain-containing protein n=1 Tax=Actinopolymorpha sp. B17G11 TaxID=3160861 RepID=UPI0032E4BE5C